MSNYYAIPGARGPEDEIMQMFKALREGKAVRASLLRKCVGYPLDGYGHVAVAAKLARDFIERDGNSYVASPLLCFDGPVKGHPLPGIAACSQAERLFRVTIMELGMSVEEDRPTVFVDNEEKPFLLRKAGLVHSALTLQESAVDGVRIPAGAIVAVNGGGYVDGGGVIAVADKPDMRVGPMRLVHEERLFPVAEMVERVGEFVQQFG